MDEFAGLCRRLGLPRKLGKRLLHPFTAPSPIRVKPLAPQPPLTLCLEVHQSVQKRARIAQQKVVCRPVQVEFFIRAIDTNELSGAGKEWRIAKVQLIVQPATDHDCDIAFLQRPL